MYNGQNILLQFEDKEREGSRRGERAGREGERERGKRGGERNKRKTRIPGSPTNAKVTHKSMTREPTQ